MPQISELTPAAAIGPFIFVIAVSVIREAYEFYKKASYDKLYNNSECIKLDHDGVYKQGKWKDLEVGDIIKIRANEIIPADVIVLQSSQRNGYCYLETTNLDGESALKPKQALNFSQNFQNSLNQLRGEIEVDPPNNNIYSFEGVVIFEEQEKVYVNIEHLLLRGGRLKNVKEVDGLVVYTGKETKMMKNIKYLI